MLIRFLRQRLRLELLQHRLQHPSLHLRLLDHRGRLNSHFGRRHHRNRSRQLMQSNYAHHHRRGHLQAGRQKEGARGAGKAEEPGCGGSEPESAPGDAAAPSDLPVRTARTARSAKRRNDGQSGI